MRGCSKSTGWKTGKYHLCAMDNIFSKRIIVKNWSDFTVESMHWSCIVSNSTKGNINPQYPSILGVALLWCVPISLMSCCRKSRCYYSKWTWFWSFYFVAHLQVNWRSRIHNLSRTWHHSCNCTSVRDVAVLWCVPISLIQCYYSKWQWFWSV